MKDEAKILADVLGPGNFSKIAKECEVTRPHVSRVLRGLTGCTVALSKKIAVCVGCSQIEVQKYVEMKRSLLVM